MVKLRVFLPITQVVFQKVESPVLEEVLELDSTERNEEALVKQKLISMPKNFTNNYIPEYVFDNLQWYQRDGLMTYIDKLKYDNFIRDEHFKITKVVNFDMIY